MPSEKHQAQKIWAHYKYEILAQSPKIYLEIRQYLKQESISLTKLENLIQTAQALPENRSHYTVAFQHIWGYFKKKASPSEKEDFLFELQRYQAGQIPASQIISNLNKLLQAYPNPYLEGSSLLHFKKTN